MEHPQHRERKKDTLSIELSPVLNPESNEATVLNAEMLNSSDFIAVGSQNVILTNTKHSVSRINYEQVRRVLDPSDTLTWEAAAKLLQREEGLAKILAEHFPDHMLPIDFTWQRVTFSPEVFKYAKQMTDEMFNTESQYTPPDLPVTCSTLVGKQPLFVVPEGAEVLSLQADKIDIHSVVPYHGHSGERDSEDPRGIRTRAAMNELLCQVEDGAFAFGWSPETDASFVQAAYGPRNTIYLSEKMEADEKFREVHRAFLERCAAFTHKTGEMVDLFGNDNILAISSEDGGWDITMVDAIYPFENCHDLFVDFVNNNVDPSSMPPEDKDDLIYFQNNTLTYIRHVNLLSTLAGLDAPFDVRHANFDPNQERLVEEVSWQQWCELQEISYAYMKRINMEPQDQASPTGLYRSVLTTT